jgi:ABC-type multidrug transport system fused ATPase/permease subunit
VNLYGRTFSILKQYWKRLLTASISAAIYSLLTGLMLWMIGPLMMALFKVESSSMFPGMGTEFVQPIPPGSAGGALPLGESQAWIYQIKDSFKMWIDGLVSSPDRSGVIFNFCILILIVALAKNIFYYLQAYYMVWVQQSVMRNFRDRLFAKYQRLSLAYFHSLRTGQIISRVTNDVSVLNESIDIGFNQLVSDGVLVIVLAASLIVLSWELTLMAALVLPLVFWFMMYIGRKMRKYSERAQQKMADVNSVLEESVNNVRIVKAFSMEDFESKKFFRTTWDYFRSLVRMRRIRHLSSPINDMLATFAGIVILYVAGTKIIEGTGKLDVGDFMTFILVMFTMIKPVKSLSQIHIKLQEGMAAAERIFEVLDAEEDVVEAPDALTIEQFKSSIGYDHVSFAYRGTGPILSDVSLEVKHGHCRSLGRRQVDPAGSPAEVLRSAAGGDFDRRRGRTQPDAQVTARSDGDCDAGDLSVQRYRA